MKKHVKALTYAPKIAPVRSGDCRQTIREGDKAAVGDEILFHGWAGRPYRSSWDWRLRATVTKVIQIVADYHDGVGWIHPIWHLCHAEHSDYRWYGWDSEYVNNLARLDYIDPPTGIELRDVLFGFGRKQSIMPMQIIRW